MQHSRFKRIVVGAVGAIFAFYILSYAVLSVSGRWVEFVRPGGQAFAAHHPRGCFHVYTMGPKKFRRLTWVGGFYLPLVLVDRFLIHETVLTISGEGDMERVRSVTDGKLSEP